MGSRVQVPFAINRIATTSLVDQFVRGLRQAIASGRYKPGEVLPTRKEFAEALGVSERVPREGVAILATEGAVYTRRCLGCVVAKRGERTWQGRVLFIEAENYGFYYQALSASFHRRMLSAGYLVSSVFCPLERFRKFNAEPLRAALMQSVDFVVLPFENQTVIHLLEDAGLPYLVAARECSTGPCCRELFTVGYDEAIADFIRQCEKSGVRTILQVGRKGAGEFLDLRKLLMYERFDLKSWFVEPARCRGPLEDVVYGAMRAFRERLKDGNAKLPDVLFFLDDYVASGALMALTAAGVRIPEDVRVVALSNRGNCPVFVKALARMEIDPLKNGEVLAEHVLAHLRPSRYGWVGEVAYRFFKGDTI